MARRRGNLFAQLAQTMARAQREADRERRRQAGEAARRQRETEQDRRRQVAEETRQQREAARMVATNERERRQQHVEQRIQEALDHTDALHAYLIELSNVLTTTLDKDDTISFDSLRGRPTPPFMPPAHLAEPLPPPKRLGFLQGILPSGERKHRDAVEEHRRAESQRLADLDAARLEHERATAAQRSAEECQIDAFEEAYRSGDRDAIIAYNSMVLERSMYPGGFPQTFRVTYSPESKELVIDYELPPPSIVPEVEAYTYVKSRDTIEAKARKPAESRALYQDVVASVALRTLHEAYEADQGPHIQVADFNGFVRSTDPATGQDISPCLISVRVTRDRLLELNLARVDRQTCLRNLGAQVSPRPAELQAVRPIVEFDMVDRRYVDQSDVLSGLDSRPNLMDLTPSEFEHLVGNLFQRMGLETRVTRSSRDGGVDAVVYDMRPVIGGKIVVQAKRYRHTVGVSAVRDLFGTMDHERANKGILVTTSGFGPDAHDFAKGKQIELVDGGNLLYLLEQVGVKARIIFPDE